MNESFEAALSEEITKLKEDGRVRDAELVNKILKKIQ